MADKGVKFTKDAAGKLVGMYEQNRQRPIHSRQPRGNPASIAPYWFWAEIGENDGSGHYSWKRVVGGSLGSVGTDEDAGSGNHEDDSGWAVEITGNEHVPEGKKVWMMAAATADYYMFLYPCQAKVARFRLNGDLEKADSGAPATIYDCEAEGGEVDAGVSNYDEWEGDSGQYGVAVYSCCDEAWVIVDLPCRED